MAGGHLRESTGPGMPGPYRRALTPRPILLLAKRPALLYNKSINKQEGTP